MVRTRCGHRERCLLMSWQASPQHISLYCTSSGVGSIWVVESSRPMPAFATSSSQPVVAGAQIGGMRTRSFRTSSRISLSPVHDSPRITRHQSRLAASWFDVRTLGEDRLFQRGLQRPACLYTPSNFPRLTPPTRACENDGSRRAGSRSLRGLRRKCSTGPQINFIMCGCRP